MPATTTVTLIGVDRILDPTTSTLKKIVWISILAFCLGFLGHIIYHEIDNYKNQKTTSTIIVGSKATLPYPALTICRFPWPDKPTNISVNKGYDVLAQTTNFRFYTMGFIQQRDYEFRRSTSFYFDDKKREYSEHSCVTYNPFGRMESRGIGNRFQLEVANSERSQEALGNEVQYRYLVHDPNEYPNFAYEFTPIHADTYVTITLNYETLNFVTDCIEPNIERATEAYDCSHNCMRSPDQFAKTCTLFELDNCCLLACKPSYCQRKRYVIKSKTVLAVEHRGRKESWVLSVRFADMSFTDIVENPPALDFITWLGIIGGACGLILGLQILTFVEIGELMFEKLQAPFKKRIASNRDMSNNNTTKVEVVPMAITHK